MKATLQEIQNGKIIAIIREVPSEVIVDVAKALVAGGIRMMEITFDQKSREGIQNTLESMNLLDAEMHDEIYLGAGTVLTTEQVELAYEHGAGYIISTNVDLDVIKRTKELGMISMPGALTPTETVTAFRGGADIVKLFPAGVWGVDYIKAVRAPLSHIPVSAVGGVNAANIASFFRAGVCCVGVGNNLVSRSRAVNKEFEAITRTACEMRAQLA